MLTDKAIQDFVTANNIDGKLVYCDEETPTVADSARLLGVEPEQIVKSLVFLANGEPHLVIAAGEVRVSTKRLRDVLDVSRKKLRMARPDEVLEITGFPVGAMPPFGHKTKLTTWIDSFSVPDDAEQLFGGGGTRSAMLELSSQTLLTVTQGTYLPLSISERDE